MGTAGASRGPRTGARILAAIFGIIAVVAAVAGIIYFTKTSESLPGFLPGRRPGNTGHDTLRGIAAVVVAVAALIFAGVSFGRARTPQR